MKLAIIADSTCDLTAEELARLGVPRVPLYVHFEGTTYRDWVDITPDQLIARMQEGAAPPTTSQPTPEDFSVAYRQAVADGADQILAIVLSAELSGTFQSATIAAKEASVPVTVFDTRNASIGNGAMIRRAVAMANAGKSVDDIVEALGEIRDALQLIFTVTTLEFLQKGGRIGRASALVGSLLDIKPLLSLENGAVAPAGRARGAKKAMKMMVDKIASYRQEHPDGELVVYGLYIQNEQAADALKAAIREAGVAFHDGGNVAFGAVIGVHVGPGTYGCYAFADRRPELPR